MKRRNFSLMSATSLAALSAGLGWLPKRASAAATAQAELLKTTLTPSGAERAGNADGTIPAWTGGETTTPPGWTPDQIMPDMYADDKKLFSIDATNMAQYADKLTPALMAMMAKHSDFRIDVYPTRRSAAAPQWVYDNIYQNALNAKPDPGGARLGFSGAYGGIPFPIPDSDPYQAGGQIIKNHVCRWEVEYLERVAGSYIMSGGVLTEASAYKFWGQYDYYLQDGNLANYTGILRRLRYIYVGPSNEVGLQLVQLEPTDPLNTPDLVWEYLSGEGRVRKAPELHYDTPSGSTNGYTTYDEYYVFHGPTDRFDWKLLGKKEMFIPYNNNKLFLSTAQDAHKPNFLDPSLVRFELHRVWVVDATVHPGERNIVPHRRFYMDEDSWIALLADEWDAQGNLWKLNMGFLEVRPDIPSVIQSNSVLYDLQNTSGYCTLNGPWANPPYNAPLVLTRPSPSLFNPQSMAAQDQY